MIPNNATRWQMEQHDFKFRKILNVISAGDRTFRHGPPPKNHTEAEGSFR